VLQRVGRDGGNVGEFQSAWKVLTVTTVFLVMCSTQRNCRKYSFVSKRRVRSCSCRRKCHHVTASSVQRRRSFGRSTYTRSSADVRTIPQCRRPVPRIRVFLATTSFAVNTGWPRTTKMPSLGSIASVCLTTLSLVHFPLDTLYRGPVWAWGRCTISPPRFLAECCKRQVNQDSFVCCILVCLLFLICIEFVFACTVLFVSISQVIGCEDRLRNDLYCVEWGVKLYSNQTKLCTVIIYCLFCVQCL